MNKPQLKTLITKRLLIALLILGVIGLALPRVGLNVAQAFKMNIGFGTDEPSPSPSPSEEIKVISSPSPSISALPKVAKPRPSYTGDFYVDPNGEYWIDFVMSDGNSITVKRTDFWFRDFCIASPPSVVAAGDISVIKAQKFVGGRWVTANDAVISTSVPGTDQQAGCGTDVPTMQIYILYTGGAAGLAAQAASGEVISYRSFIKGGQYGDTIYGDNTFEFTVSVEKAN
jgi:hypothetical protein